MIITYSYGNHEKSDGTYVNLGDVTENEILYWMDDTMQYIIIRPGDSTYLIYRAVWSVGDSNKDVYYKLSHIIEIPLS